MHIDKLYIFLPVSIWWYNYLSSVEYCSRLLPFALYAVLDKTGQACGSLYWDDGETLGKYIICSISRMKNSWKVLRGFLC